MNITYSYPRDARNFSDDDDYIPFCSHDYPSNKGCPDCEIEDEWIESQGGLDKCLNCGKYKLGNELASNQCWKKGCVNPNEY